MAHLRQLSGDTGLDIESGVMCVVSYAQQSKRREYDTVK